MHHFSLPAYHLVTIPQKSTELGSKKKVLLNNLRMLQGENTKMLFFSQRLNWIMQHQCFQHLKNMYKSSCPIYNHTIVKLKKH